MIKDKKRIRRRLWFWFGSGILCLILFDLLRFLIAILFLESVEKFIDFRNDTNEIVLINSFQISSEFNQTTRDLKIKVSAGHKIRIPLFLLRYNEADLEKKISDIYVNNKKLDCFVALGTDSPKNIYTVSIVNNNNEINCKEIN